MNPDYQQFLTDEWQPPERECNTTTMVDNNGGSIVEANEADRWIRAEELIPLSETQ